MKRKWEPYNVRAVDLPKSYVKDIGIGNGIKLRRRGHEGHNEHKGHDVSIGKFFVHFVLLRGLCGPILLE